MHMKYEDSKNIFAFIKTRFLKLLKIMKSQLSLFTKLVTC